MIAVAAIDTVIWQPSWAGLVNVLQPMDHGPIGSLLFGLLRKQGKLEPLVSCFFFAVHLSTVVPEEEQRLSQNGAGVEHAGADAEKQHAPDGHRRVVEVVLNRQREDQQQSDDATAKHNILLQIY
jgi:hypothetical protein